MCVCVDTRVLLILNHLVIILRLGIRPLNHEGAGDREADRKRHCRLRPRNVGERARAELALSSRAPLIDQVAAVGLTLSRSQVEPSAAASLPSGERPGAQ